MNIIPPVPEFKLSSARSAAMVPRVSRLVSFVVAGSVLVLGLLIRNHYLLVLVSGESMAPTFHGGDLLVVDRKAFDRETPERTEIVVAHYKDNLVIKRVVGLPGEELEVIDGALIVNGNTVAESYVGQNEPLQISKGRVADGKLALLGDNRRIKNSLFVAPLVAQGDVIGKVATYFPLSAIFNAASAPHSNAR